MTTIPQADLDRQLALEEEGLTAGFANYMRRTTELEGKGLVSMTQHGKRLISSTVERLATAIRKFMEDAKVKPGPRAISVQYMEQIRPELLAFITIRTCLDGMARREKAQGIAVGIGISVEVEKRFEAFEKAEGKLFNTVNRNFDSSPWAYSATRRTEHLKKAARKFGVEWSKWGHADQLHLGMACLTLFVESTGLGELFLVAGGTKKAVYYLNPTAAMTEWVASFKSDASLLRPVFMPMVCPPRPWTTPYDGGYYDPRLCHRHKLVKKTNSGSSYLKELAHKEMPVVYQAINALQDTPWKINPGMLTVLHEIWEAGIEVKGMPSRFDIPRPAKPVDIDTNHEARKAYAIATAESYKANIRAGSKRIQVAKIMYLADKFSPEPSLYFPVQMDFRGRVYATPMFLNPQGNDLAKSLLTFAQGKPLGKSGVYWLGIHLANTFGNDKCSLQARHQWAVGNSERIASTANDPLADRWWMEADKPFQFLSACIEWLGYLHDGGENYVCSLPIMVDGSCNGLQHFSAMLRDPVCGAKVNLVPSEKPSDIYQAVADEACAFLASDTSSPYASLWLAYGITRKICKRPVMILPYGGTRNAVREYTLQYVIENMQDGKPHPFGRDLGRAVSYLTTIIWDTMKSVVAGPRVAMDWLIATSRLMSKARLRIYWTTPSGFWVKQAYPDTRARRVKTKIGQQTIYMTMLEELKDKLDGRKQAQGISPNFVHSMDASALMLTIVRSGSLGLSQFAAVHDSYGTVAADMNTLMDTLRASFVDMYETRDVLAEFAAGASEALAIEEVEVPALPTRGTLDLSGVLKSDFFFA